MLVLCMNNIDPYIPNKKLFYYYYYYYYYLFYFILFLNHLSCNNVHCLCFKKGLVSKQCQFFKVCVREIEFLSNFFH